jgi:hypothetical protein
MPRLTRALVHALACARAGALACALACAAWGVDAYCAASAALTRWGVLGGADLVTDGHAAVCLAAAAGLTPAAVAWAYRRHDVPSASDWRDACRRFGAPECGSPEHTLAVLGTGGWRVLRMGGAHRAQEKARGGGTLELRVLGGGRVGGILRDLP